MKHRSEVIESLAVLPTTPIIEYQEVLTFIETHKLFGQGLGRWMVHGKNGQKSSAATP